MSQMKEIVRLSRLEGMEYELLKLPGKSETLVAREEDILHQLEQYGVPRQAFASYKSVGQHIHSFESSFNDLQNIEVLPNGANRDQVTSKANDLRSTILKSSKNTSWSEIFKLIFDYVQVWSNGTDVVFIWGVKLSKNEAYDWQKREERPTNTVPTEDQGLINDDRTEIDQDLGNSTGADDISVVRNDAANDVDSGHEAGWWAEQDWRRWLLWLALVFIFLAWVWLLITCWGSNPRPVQSLTSGAVIQNPLPGRLPDVPNAQVPWNPEQVVTDPIAGPHVENRWNIAFTSDQKTYIEFAQAVDSVLPKESAELVYWDDLIGRIQFNWLDPRKFDPEEIKTALSDFGPLVWSERLLGSNVVAGQSSTNTDIWHLEAIQWVAGSGAQRVIPRIGVIDDGFDLASSGLIDATGTALNLAARDTVVNSSDARSHGTHVASLACAPEGKDSLFHGVSQHSELVPIQLTEVDEPTFPMTGVIDGILYAARNGVSVINLSLGGIFPYAEEYQSLTQKEREVLLGQMMDLTRDERRFWSHLYAILESRGISVVVAAGNDTMPLEWDPMHSSRYPIYVTAFDRMGSMSDFSNYISSDVDSLTVVCAPGEDIQSYVHGGKLVAMSGTSMAAPLVAGAVAEMRVGNPDLNPAQIRNRMQNLKWFSKRGGTKLFWPQLMTNNENV